MSKKKGKEPKSPTREIDSDEEKEDRELTAMLEESRKAMGGEWFNPEASTSQASINPQKSPTKSPKKAVKQKKSAPETWLTGVQLPYQRGTPKFRPIYINKKGVKSEDPFQHTLPVEYKDMGTETLHRRSTELDPHISRLLTGERHTTTLHPLQKSKILHSYRKKIATIKSAKLRRGSRNLITFYKNLMDEIIPRAKEQFDNTIHNWIAEKEFVYIEHGEPVYTDLIHARTILEKFTFEQMLNISQVLTELIEDIQGNLAEVLGDWDQKVSQEEFVYNRTWEMYYYNLMEYLGSYFHQVDQILKDMMSNQPEH